jgi:predicted RNase H-like nuclease (RuvC/YqgF family)
MDDYVTKNEFNTRTDQLQAEIREITSEVSSLKNFMVNKFDQLFGLIFDMKRDHEVMGHTVDRIETKLDNHERRIQRLERMHELPRMS